MSKKKIEDCIRDSLEQYFKDLRGAEPRHRAHRERHRQERAEHRVGQRQRIRLRRQVEQARRVARRVIAWAPNAFAARRVSAFALPLK